MIGQMVENNFKDMMNYQGVHLVLFPFILNFIVRNIVTYMCDRSHSDARWIGGLSHQSGNLSHLHNLLQKVVICPCSNTRFEQIKVENYPAK